MVAGDLGAFELALASVLAGVIAFLVIRRQLRRAAAKREEVRRRALLAAQEAEWVEREAVEYFSGGGGREYVAASTVAAVEKEEEAVTRAKEKGVCAVCCRPTTRRCAKCKVVKYCSFHCQIFDWRRGHKAECRPPNGGDQLSAGTSVTNQNAQKGNQNDLSGSSMTHDEWRVFEDSKYSSTPPQIYQNSFVASNSSDKIDSKHPSNVYTPAFDENDMAMKEHNTLSSREINGPSVEKKFFRRPEHGGDSDAVKSLLSEVVPNKLFVDSNYSSRATEEVSGLKDSKKVHKVSGSSSFQDIRTEISPSSHVQKSSKVGLRSSTIEGSSSAASILEGKINETQSSAVNSSRHMKNSAPELVSGMSKGSVEHVRRTVKQLATSKLMRNHVLNQMIFQYDEFVKLYYSDKIELQPFGLINVGNSCYANVVLQCLMFTRPLTAYLLDGLHSKSCSQEEWCFTCEFEKLAMMGKQKSQHSPASIVSKLNGFGTLFGPGKQEDAHEFLRYVVDTMQLICLKEAKQRGLDRLSEDTTFVQLIFGGYLRSKVKCSRCSGYSEQQERILDLALEIDGDIGTLEEALVRYTSTEVLDGENQYFCARCNSYQRARKKLSIVEAPNVLTIALKRYQPGKFGKISKSVCYPDILNLAPYMRGKEDKSPVYRLYAVVVHRDDMNSTFSGHYICYVKDAQGKWYKINDSQVKSATSQKVLSRCAYMLLYARCSPRAPTLLRRVMPHEASSAKSSSSSGSRRQATYYSRDPSDSSSDSFSFFSQSDECASSTFSTESTSNSISTDNDLLFSEPDWFNSDGNLRSPDTHHDPDVVSPSSSGQWADQAGDSQALGGGWFESFWEPSPVLYADHSDRGLEVEEWDNPTNGMLSRGSIERTH